MPFRFKKRESLSKAIRRVGCEQMQDALAHLEDCSQAEAIHSARKNIKKVRVLRAYAEKTNTKVSVAYTKALGLPVSISTEPQNGRGFKIEGRL